MGYGKPPVHSRFKKGQSGNPRGLRPKNLPALLIDAPNEKLVATIDGERRGITRREAVVTQLVNKSTGADPLTAGPRRRGHSVSQGQHHSRRVFSRSPVPQSHP
jgi:hypothetical protein